MPSFDNNDPQINRLRVALRLALYAFRDYKYRVAALAGLGFLSGFLEGIGVNAMIPLLSFFVTTPGAENYDFITRAISKFFSFLGLPLNLPVLLIFISVLFIGKAFSLLIFSYIRIRITSEYETKMRAMLFGDILRAGWPYLLHQKLGYLENALMNDVRNSSIMLSDLSGTLMVVGGLTMYLAVALNISVPITLIALAIGAVIFFTFKPLMVKMRGLSQKTLELNKEVARHINEHVLGLKLIKSLLAETPVVRHGREHFERLERYRIKAFNYRTIATVFIQPISVVFMSVLLLFSYKYDPNFNFAAIIAIVYLIQRIFVYTERMQNELYSVSGMVPYLESVLLLEEQARSWREQEEGERPFKFHSELNFEKVSFRYNEKGPKVLNDVSFKVKKGEFIGFVGMSGTGKTTIFDLILRLFKPTEGQILLDEEGASSIKLKEWRSTVGYVPQDVFIVSGTVADNIRFYDHSINEHEMVSAAKAAHANEFITKLPKGYETLVGERGIELSTGQRQRIAIARILARKPQILLLDEATSALDNESELKVQEAIEHLKRNITVLVIAHRLDTVMNADKIFVIENGRITEAGAPLELLKDKSSYFYKTYHVRG